MKLGDIVQRYNSKLDIMPENEWGIIIDHRWPESAGDEVEFWVLWPTSAITHEDPDELITFDRYLQVSGRHV